MKKILRGLKNFLKFKPITGSLLLIVLFVGVGSPLYYLSHPSPAARRNDVYDKLMNILQTRTEEFEGEVGIYIKDLKTDNTLCINSEKLFPSASLVKIPIMAAVYKANEEKKLLLTDKIRLRWTQKVRDSSRLYFARSGRRFTVKDLVERMIEESDNTATNMLVDALGFGYINQKFVDFGLRETDLRRGVMDLKWRNRGIENFTTCEEMAFLLEKIYNKELVSKEASEEMLEILKRQKVRDRIPRWLPNDLDIAHKTGSLRNTISDVGIVFAPQSDFIICVITGGELKNYRVAKRFISTVAKDIYSFYQKS